MIGAILQKPRQAVVEILDFMRKRGLTLNDLIQIGGEDFTSPSPMRKEKARRVEKCWHLMARLSVKFADLEATPPPIPDKPARRRRGEGVFSEVVENKEISGTTTHQHKSNEINDLANSAPIGVPRIQIGGRNDFHHHRSVSRSTAQPFRCDLCGPAVAVQDVVAERTGTIGRSALLDIVTCRSGSDASR
jgi:hypothetical protein